MRLTVADLDTVAAALRTLSKENINVGHIIVAGHKFELESELQDNQHESQTRAYTIVDIDNEESCG